MIIKTSDTNSIKPFLKRLYLPQSDSHKGQNGKVMVMGGSSLFHSAVIWSAEIASYFADMVHFASTQENNGIITSIKKKWQNGIVVPQSDIYTYIEEDDVILLGTGMMREGVEGKRTYEMTESLLKRFPDKKWVIDAGALQVMDKGWLKLLRTKPILTPHQKEFEMLFGEKVASLDQAGKTEVVKKTAYAYGCVILLKAGYDIMSDGESTFIVEGGNAGLTKGGTGDVLAGLAAALYAKNEPLESSVMASFLLKKTAEELYKRKGYWYNNSDLIASISTVLYSTYKSILG